MREFVYFPQSFTFMAVSITQKGGMVFHSYCDSTVAGATAL